MKSNFTLHKLGPHILLELIARGRVMPWSEVLMFSTWPVCAADSSPLLAFSPSPGYRVAGVSEIIVPKK